MEFTLIDRSKIREDILKKAADEAFSLLPNRKGEIELKFVNEKEIRELNREYRGVDKPTDVLSFTISESPLIGQIIICYNMARKQAEAKMHEIEKEVSLLLVHGILHVFGFDHLTDEEAAEMEKTEIEILKNAGVV